MTAPGRAALGERAARALSAWGLGDGYDKLHALIVEWGVVERAIEREACAVVVHGTDVETYYWAGTLHDDGAKTLGNAARAIRARGTESKTGGR